MAVFNKKQKEEVGIGIPPEEPETEAVIENNIMLKQLISEDN